MPRTPLGSLAAVILALLVAACAGGSSGGPQWTPRGEAASLLTAAEDAHNRGEYRESNRLLRRLAPHLSDNPPALAAVHGMRALNHISLGDYELALADTNNGLRLEPGNADLLRTRGRVHLLLKRYHEAVADLSASLRAKRDARSYLLRSHAYVGLERYELARDDLLRYLNVQRDDADAWYRLGLIYILLEQDTLALAAFYLTVELDGSHREAQQYMVDLGCPYTAYARNRCP